MNHRFKPRRPYIDKEPKGYLESDLDFIANNHNLVMSFLEGRGEIINRYHIVITSRPGCHPYELRLDGYLISPTGFQARVHSGFNPPDTEGQIRRLLKRKWPGIPIHRDDNLYVVGIDPVPETHAERNNR